MKQKASSIIVNTGQTVLWLYSRFLVKIILNVEIKKPTLEFKNHTSIMVISSHVSLFDPSILVGSLSWSEFRHVYPIRALLAKWYYHSPLLPFVYFIGCFPARPLIPAWKMYAGTTAAVKILKSGQSLGIYPEGQRTRGERLPAKFGVVKILQQVPEQKVYLCKITKVSRRRFTMSLERQDRVAGYTEPDKIMDEVYTLQ